MLKSGSRGDEVLSLQRRLKAAGFDPGGADGAFGPKTDAALRAFQEKAEITADGICGPKTLEKLHEAINALTTMGDAPAADAPKEDGASPL
mgnify:CR=1 FL=1